MLINSYYSWNWECEGKFVIQKIFDEQTNIDYEIGEVSEEWTVIVFVTDEQLEYVGKDSIVNLQIEEINKSFTGKIQSIVSYANQSRTGYQVEITINSSNAEIAGKKAKVAI